MQLARVMSTQINGANGSDGIFGAHRAHYEKTAVATSYADMHSWIDAGERVAFSFIADDARGRPILDIGVGAGRTSWWLRLLSPDYVAIDASRQMVQVCRQVLPDLDVRFGDARDLSEFEPERFALVVFSYNGIDSVGHEDRQRVLQQCHRILRPGGLLVFSTRNKNGPNWGQAPWQTVRRYTTPERSRLEVATRLLARTTLRLPREVRIYRNWWRLKKCLEDHGEWGIGPGPLHLEFLVHYITTKGELDELASTGFGVRAMFSQSGQRLDPAEPNVDSFWFYVVASR
jgi:SAM-dependent methyltransferase